MAKKPPRTIEVGRNGEVRLPADAMEALELEPGAQVQIRIDKRRKVIQLERHVDDPWAEAMRPKQGKELDDLLAEQTEREAEAQRLFEERLKDKDSHEPRRPEDDPGHWR